LEQKRENDDFETKDLSLIDFQHARRHSVQNEHFK